MNANKVQTNSIAKPTATVGLFTLLSRILGMIRDIVVANYFGAGMMADAFFVAFKVPNLLRRLVAEGSLAAAFIPIFNAQLTESKDCAKRALGATATFSLALTCSLTALGIIFATELTYLFAPGFSEHAEKTLLTARLMQFLFPFVILISLQAVISGALNSFGYFAVPAAGPAILNIVMIAACFLFTGALSEPIYALAAAVPLGGLLALVTQLLQLRAISFPLVLFAPWRVPAMRSLVRLMLPSVLSASAYQLMVFFNTLLASLLQEGSVSWLYYADRLFQFPLGVFSLAVATAVLPQLSKFAASKDEENFSRSVHSALDWVSIVCIPATFGLILLAEPLVSIIFLRGEFNSEHVQQTSLALAAFSLGLWPLSCQAVLVRAFLAKHNSFMPAVVSTVFIVINAILAVCLMGPVTSGEDTTFGRIVIILQSILPTYPSAHWGLALAGSISSLLSALTLAALLNTTGTLFNYKPFISVGLKSLLASSVMGVTIEALRNTSDSSLVNLALTIPSAIAIYFCLLLVLFDKQTGPLRVISNWAKRPLLKRKD